MVRRRSLIGRDRELGELTASLEDALAGHGGVVLLVGEPGIGKSRLAEELASAAEARNVTVRWGRCWEAGGAPAYWPWIQILRALVRGPEVAARAAELGPASPLAALLPELGAPGLGAGAADPAQARFQLFDAATGLLVAAAERTPLCLILDDLHAADVSSLRLLAYLARELRGARILVVGSYRDVDARLTAEVGPLLAQVARDSRTLALQRFDRAEVAALLAQSLAEVAADDLVDTLHRVSEGNPLFLGEMLRVRGRLGSGAERLPIPDGVRAAIRQHLRHVSAEVASLLEVAATVGREFSLVVLAAATGQRAEHLRDLLAEAVAAELVGEPAAAHYVFSHMLIPETIQQDLGAARRAALHLQVAAALETVHAGDPTPPWAELAHHYFEAAPEGLARAIDCAERAARRAATLLAFEDAAAQLERALAALAQVAPADRARRCDLLIGLGEAHLRAGARTPGQASCARAAELARSLGDGERLARAALGYGANFAVGTVDPTMIALLESALRALGERAGALRAQLLARLAAAKQPAVDPRQPIELARQALAMVDRDGDPLTRLRVLYAAGSAMADFAPPAERIGVNLELVALADELGDKVIALRGHLRLVFDRLELGEHLQADAHIAALEHLAGEFRQPAYRWPALLCRAMRAGMTGDFAEAERHHAEGRALIERLDDQSARRIADFQRYGLLWAQARDRELLEHVAHAGWDLTGLAQAAPLADLMAGAAAGLAGDLDRARACAAQIPEQVLLYPDLSQYGMAAFLLAAVRDPRAALLYDQMLPIAAHDITWGIAGIWLAGPATWSLGLLAGALDRWDDAERHLDDALARALVAGLRPASARIRFDHAEVLLRRGRAEDRARAASLLEQAAPLATQMEMAGLIPRIAARLAEAGAAPAPPPAPPAAVTFVLRRDGEYWTASGGAGPEVRLKDSRGLHLLAQLVASPGRELHVLDLMGAGGGEPVGGDSGELLDREARDAYRARAAELDEELAQAEAWNDAARAERLRAEREFLAGELARAVGLGGRERRAGSAAERARVNVQRRLRDAVRRIAEHDPALGRHLERAVRTGLFCCYEPER